MLSFSPLLSEIRFGCGASPSKAAPASAQAMLDRVTGPDEMAGQFPVDDWDSFTKRLITYQKYRQDRETAQGDARAALRQKFLGMEHDAADRQMHFLRQQILRRCETTDGFRERLSAFWTDHFTTTNLNGIFRYSVAIFTDSVIRPNMTGNFTDMAWDVLHQPLMLESLNQRMSIGTNSTSGLKRPERAGANENLGREFLELHTLGVGGGYDQTDVHQMSELLTGMSFRMRTGDFHFQRAYAEPGVKTVLGRQYGSPGKPATEDEIRAAVADICTRPATAKHISGKLARHFVSATPSQALVDHMTVRFMETGGDLAQVYEAMLTHPDAWDAPLQGKVKWPIDYIGSACRALDLGRDQLASLTPDQIRAVFAAPLEMMGQKWEDPIGPNGWSEADEDWITAQRYAARLQWAVDAPVALRPDLPHAPALLDASLGALAPDRLTRAVAQSRKPAEGAALLFASPAFQRL